MKNKNTNISAQEYVRKKALGLIGLVDSEIDPRVRAERLTFVNDINEIQRDKLEEYNVWYEGDSDGLLNFYTRAHTIDYNYNPLYNRNKKSYFWSVASTEGDIKRTHSGQARNITDTLVNIIGVPRVGVGEPGSVLREVDNRLAKILKKNNFAFKLTQKARPLTLVEGWGAWKINWDSSFCSVPLLMYYRADAVDFVYKFDQLVAIIYKDYFQDENEKNYILFETRRIDKKDGYPCLIIEKDLFLVNNGSRVLTKMELNELPQLKDVNDRIIIENFDRFLGYPCIYFYDSTGDCYGRSIFTGKIDLLDDLDQCHSQAANTVRRSTTHEYFDTLYLEKDREGLPIMPKDFDRKYISFSSPRGGDGVSGNGPVTVTQPRVEFNQYSSEEINILLNIISGYMSPATLGIDIAKKDNAEAQREKEKVTIFTRNTVIAEENKILEALGNDLLCADELMRTGKVTNKEYDIFVQYDEFADASFEGKLKTVLDGWQSGLLSDDMAVEYLYGDTVSKEIRDRELKVLKENRRKEEEMNSGDELSEDELGELGELLGGNNNNEHNEKMRKHNI